MGCGAWIATKRGGGMGMGEQSERIGRLEERVRRDPAGRGLISSEATRGVLCEGHLAAAAADLASKSGPVAILTGFFIPHGEPAAAETDGPPGAATLARVLVGLGREVVLLTDLPCEGAMRATAAAAGLEEVELAVAPLEGSSRWCREFLAGRRDGGGLDHLVVIERVGPSHTVDSMRAQARDGDPPEAEFLERVPAKSWGCCHNMRARVIDEWTADVLLSAYPKFSPSVALAAYFPEAAQAYYDDALEPLFNAAVPTLATLKASTPAPLVGLALVAGDAALATGFGAYVLGLKGAATLAAVAAAAALASVAARRTARK